MRVVTLRRTCLYCVILYFSLNISAFGYDWGTNTGDGSEGNPFLISDANQMQAIGDSPYIWDKHFILSSDIDLSDFDGHDGRPAFNIIGTTVLETPIGIAYDANDGKIYWTDSTSNKIQRANIDGSEIEDLVTGLNKPIGISLDVNEGKIYWTDILANTIQRANLDGSYVEDLITTNLNNPAGICIDASNGKMYWAEPGSDMIRRANLDGSVIENVITTGLINPRNIALDSANGKIYWTDSGTDKIQRSDLDGSMVEDIVINLGDPMGIDIDVGAGKIYWTERYAERIKRANLNGTGIEELLDLRNELSTLLDISINVPEGKMYFINGDRFQLANLDGTELTLLLANYFRGTFDGNNHSIINFAFQSNTQKPTGLFGEIENPLSIIKNLTLVEPNVIAESSMHVGTLAGGISAGKLINCFIEGGSLSGDKTVGGLVGANTGVISNCLTSINVRGNNAIGGIAGANYGSLINCYSTGDCIGNDGPYDYYGTVGGIAGYNSGDITRCSSACNVSGPGAIGGLVGFHSRFKQVDSINKCFSESTVSGSIDIGGIVGVSNNNISNCYATGIVMGETNVGGLVGRILNYNVSDSYFAGMVSGTSNVGGIVGNASSENVTGSYFLASVVPDNVFGTPLDDPNMMIQSNFTNWDFLGESINGQNDIWRMCIDSVDYPRLSWEFAQNGDFACGDGTDILDLLALAEHWLLTEELNPDTFNYSCDANGDGVINLLDYSVLGSNW